MSIFFNETSDLQDDRLRAGAIEGIPDEAKDGASDAIVADQISKKLTSDEVKVFADSEEAKELIAKDILKEETVEAMKDIQDDDEDMIRVAALNIAKNKQDPKFDEAVEKKKETEEIIEDIVDDNREEAEAIVEAMRRNVFPGIKVLSGRGIL